MTQGAHRWDVGVACCGWGWSPARRRRSLVSVDLGGGSAAGQSTKGAVSADGTLVAFQSFAADLVPGATNGDWQIYLRDLVGGTTTRVSTAADGTEGGGHSVNPTISADGRHVAFESRASNLVAADTNGVSDVFVKDIVTGEIERVSVGSGGGEAAGSSIRPSLSADGRYVAFGSDAADLVAGDTNAVGDSFVHDRSRVRPPASPSPPPVRRPT